MFLNKATYVPSIRWRQGEYQALFHLCDAVKDRVVPLIMIPPVEYDFEENRLKRSVQEHVHPFIDRFDSKWRFRPAWIGVHDDLGQSHMDNGVDIFTYVFSELRSFLAGIVPLISLSSDADIVSSVGAIIMQDGRGVGISVRLEDLMKEDLSSRLQHLISELKADKDVVDLIIDLQAPNFLPYRVFNRLLTEKLAALVGLCRYRNLIIISTAIPDSLGAISVGLTKIPRHDWLFFKSLVANTRDNIRLPNFGDYTLVHPKFSARDMRMVKSSGKIFYSASDYWWVQKGGVFRENKEQMYDHCARLVKEAIFKGGEYSYGDNYIDKCANREEGPSNLTRWKEVTINHHITQVVDDLAKLFEASCIAESM